jgi:hypothetical protein
MLNFYAIIYLSHYYQEKNSTKGEIMKSYRLKNHNPTDNDTTINASIEILDSKLKLNYQVVGDISKYHFQSKTTQHRADNL